MPVASSTHVGHEEEDEARDDAEYSATIGLSLVLGESLDNIFLVNDKLSK